MPGLCPVCCPYRGRGRWPGPMLCCQGIVTSGKTSSSNTSSCFPLFTGFGGRGGERGTERVPVASNSGGYRRTHSVVCGDSERRAGSKRPPPSAGWQRQLRVSPAHFPFLLSPQTPKVSWAVGSPGEVLITPPRRPGSGTGRESELRPMKEVRSQLTSSCSDAAGCCLLPFPPFASPAGHRTGAAPSGDAPTPT